jgi:hypothetical protein
MHVGWSWKIMDKEGELFPSGKQQAHFRLPWDRRRIILDPMHWWHMCHRVEVGEENTPRQNRGRVAQIQAFSLTKE